MILTEDVNEVIEMIQVCKSNAIKTYDPYEGPSTQLTGISLDLFLFVMDKAIAILKEV